MALHFSAEEFAGRRERAIALMEQRGLHGLLMFRQETWMGGLKCERHFALDDGW